MPRPTQQESRDRLGILGSPIGATHALIGVDAQYTNSTNDFFLAAKLEISDDRTGTDMYLMSNRNGAVDLHLIFRPSTGVLRLHIAGANYDSAVVVSPYGRILHIVVFADRSGNAYFYVDGVFLSLVDISGSVAANLDGTQWELGGSYISGVTDISMLYRHFIIAPVNFPSRAEMDTIANERFLNPDHETPVLANRPNYATERRVDIPLIDDHQDIGTVQNHGTGGVFTIGGGLLLHDVRTQAERAAITKPDEIWYSFDEGHEASNAAADIGCAQGSYILEGIYKDTLLTPTNCYLLRIADAGGTDWLYFYLYAVGALEFGLSSAGVPSIIVPWAPGYPEYGRNGLHVIHLVYDAVANEFSAWINGQWLRANTIVADLDLSGNCLFQLGTSVRRDGMMAMRLWNWAGAVAPPTGWEQTVLQRVHNPWDREVDFDAAAILGEWLLSAEAQDAASLIIPNQIQPGTGDLTIAPGAAFGASRVPMIGGI